jgi:hypothetical protein
MTWDAGTLVFCVLPDCFSSLCSIWRWFRVQPLTQQGFFDRNINRAGDFQQTSILICCQLFKICHTASACGHRIGKLDTFCYCSILWIVVFIIFTIFEFRWIALSVVLSYCSLIQAANCWMSTSTDRICTMCWPHCRRRYSGSYLNNSLITMLLVKCDFFPTFSTVTAKFSTKF